MDQLTPEQLQAYVAIATGLLTSVVLGLLILVVGWRISAGAHRAVMRSCEASRLDTALARFLSSLAQYTVLAATFIAALQQVGVQTTSLVAIFASAGLAVGLALQGSLANFAAGVMILFFRPFQLDDVITAGGHTGKVVDIGLFASTFYTPDNMKIIVPNSAIIGGSIVNITALGTRRLEVDVGVAYGEDIERVRAVLLAATQVEGAERTPAAAVAFTGLGPNALSFKVMVWCKSGDYLIVLDRVRTSVYAALQREGIEIPYNQLVVHQAPPQA